MYSTWQYTPRRNTTYPTISHALSLHAAFCSKDACGRATMPCVSSRYSAVRTMTRSTQPDCIVPHLIIQVPKLLLLDLCAGDALAQDVSSGDLAILTDEHVD